MAKIPRDVIYILHLYHYYYYLLTFPEFPAFTHLNNIGAHLHFYGAEVFLKLSLSAAGIGGVKAVQEAQFPLQYLK